MFYSGNLKYAKQVCSCPHTSRSRQQQMECNQVQQQQQRPPSRPSSRQALLQQELQDQQNFTRSRSLGGYYQQVCYDDKQDFKKSMTAKDTS